MKYFLWQIIQVIVRLLQQKTLFVMITTDILAVFFSLLPWINSQKLPYSDEYH